MTTSKEKTNRLTKGKIANEFKTIKAMIRLYCRSQHSSSHLCNDCLELLNYAEKRLILCPHQEKKPTCANCITHCYKKDMQDKIVRVMRYSGPRMIYHHPIMAIRHIFDGRIKPSLLPRKRKKS